MTLSCHGCGKQLPPSRGPGRQRKWCTNRCRRQTLYAGSCVDCGAPTNGYNGPGKASKRCVACAAADRKIWTREALIAAIQAWADETGGIPPTATDWNPSMAHNLGHPEKAEKFYADNAWLLAMRRAARASMGATARTLSCAVRSPTGTRRANRHMLWLRTMAVAPRRSAIACRGVAAKFAHDPTRCVCDGSVRGPRHECY